VAEPPLTWWFNHPNEYGGDGLATPKAMGYVDWPPLIFYFILFLFLFYLFLMLKRIGVL
jgi:hypothetical protein